MDSHLGPTLQRCTPYKQSHASDVHAQRQASDTHTAVTMDDQSHSTATLGRPCNSVPRTSNHKHLMLMQTQTSDTLSSVAIIDQSHSPATLGPATLHPSQTITRDTRTDTDATIDGRFMTRLMLWAARPCLHKEMISRRSFWGNKRQIALQRFWAGAMELPNQAYVATADPSLALEQTQPHEARERKACWSMSQKTAQIQFTVTLTPPTPMLVAPLSPKIL